MKLCIIDTPCNNLLTGAIVWMFSYASTVPMNVASCTHYNNMYINYVFVFKIMRFIRFLMEFNRGRMHSASNSFEVQSITHFCDSEKCYLWSFLFFIFSLYTAEYIIILYSSHNAFIQSDYLNILKTLVILNAIHNVFLYDMKTLQTFFFKLYFYWFLSLLFLSFFNFLNEHSYLMSYSAVK